MEPEPLPLRDIHLPPEIGWWPPALGWWVLAIMLVLIIGIGYWLYKHLTKRTAVKAAKLQLQHIKQDKQLNNVQKLATISTLIRRVAISTANRNECAGLTGLEWLDYLDRPLQGKPFTEGAGRLLAETVYRKAQPNNQEIDQLIGLCEIWLKVQSKKRK